MFGASSIGETGTTVGRCSAFSKKALSVEGAHVRFTAKSEVDFEADDETLVSITHCKCEANTEIECKFKICIIETMVDEPHAVASLNEVKAASVKPKVQGGACALDHIPHAEDHSGEDTLEKEPFCPTRCVGDESCCTWETHVAVLC